MHLDERQRRIYLASEAEALGRGGAKEISKIFGVHQNTLTAGKKDLLSCEVLPPTEKGNIRARRTGGGRKTILEKHPEIVKLLVNVNENLSHMLMKK